MYVIPDDWLEEFENLLSQLCWSHVNVNVIETYSGCRFEWQADKFDLKSIKATTQWIRKDYEPYHLINKLTNEA